MKKQLVIYMILMSIPGMLLAQWSYDPAENTMIIDNPGIQGQSKVIVNDEGQSYVSWFSAPGESGPWSVYMQRLDNDGTKLWADSGLLVSDHTTMSWTTDYGLALDDQDNAVLVTQDLRTGSSDVYAYKISPAGDFLWGADGIALTSDVDFNPSPAVNTDYDGNSIALWASEPPDNYSYITLQKLSPDGQELWNDVTIASDTMHCFQPYMTLSDDSATFVVWMECSSFDTIVGNWPYMYAYAQKIDKDGNFVWPGKVPVDTTDNMPLAAFEPSLASDGNGGLFVGWNAYPPVWPNMSAWVQHINMNGETEWVQNGVQVSDSIQFHHRGIDLLYNADIDQLFVIWNEIREYPIYKGAVFGQKFSLQGERLWTDQGQPLTQWFILSDTSFSGLGIKHTDNNDFIIFYGSEFFDVVNSDTLFHTIGMARRLDTDGNPVWNNDVTEFATSASEKYQFAFSEPANNQWICLWADNRNDPDFGPFTGIYAQNINIDGSLGIYTGLTEYIHPNEDFISNFPNPFSQYTTIQYQLMNPEYVEISLYSIQGQLVKSLSAGCQSAGTHTLQFDGSILKPGIYLIRLKTNNQTCFHKVSFVR